MNYMDIEEFRALYGMPKQKPFWSAPVRKSTPDKTENSASKTPKKARKKSKSKKHKGIPERDVLKYVLDYFKFDPNVELYRRNVASMSITDGNKKARFIRCGAKGQADVWGVIAIVRCPRCGEEVCYGKHVEIECKRYGGKLSTEQIDWLHRMKKMNSIALVVSPRPTKDDPAGLRAVGRQLEKLAYRLCEDCNREK